MHSIGKWIQLVNNKHEVWLTVRCSDEQSAPWAQQRNISTGNDHLCSSPHVIRHLAVSFKMLFELSPGDGSQFISDCFSAGCNYFWKVLSQPRTGGIEIDRLHVSCQESPHGYRNRNLIIGRNRLHFLCYLDVLLIVIDADLSKYAFLANYLLEKILDGPSLYDENFRTCQTRTSPFPYIQDRNWQNV